MRTAVVRLDVHAARVPDLRACGADIVHVAADHVVVALALALDPDGWGIVPSLGALEDRLAAHLRRPGLLIPARVLAEVSA